MDVILGQKFVMILRKQTSYWSKTGFFSVCRKSYSDGSFDVLKIFQPVQVSSERFSDIMVCYNREILLVFCAEFHCGLLLESEKLIARKSALEKTQLLDVLITDNLF